MDKLLLAIDGGGSKTHAIITTLEGEIIEEALIPQGSNPWKSGGYDKAAQAIEAAIDRLTKLDHIAACAAGISGCHSDGTFSKKFHDLIAAKLPKEAKVKIEGDLITSFRAGSPLPHGQLAVAGSGSAIAHFYPDGSNYAYDGIGYGGRDIGAAIIASVQRSEQPQHVNDWAQNVLGQDPSNLEKLGDLYHDRHVMNITKELADLASEGEIMQSLRPLLLHCAWRWAYKLWGSSQKYRTRADLGADARICTVLSGNTWQLDLLRSEVLRLLLQSDPTNTLVFTPDVAPIQGALRIAQDLIQNK